MALSIIDIAKLAGVSKSTVSRYMNNGYVSAENREKIKAVIDETGFLPQRQAISMRTKKTKLIGVIVPKITTETAPRVVEGIAEVLSPKGYDVLIANTNLSIEKEMEYLKIFKENQVDGIIFMATNITEEHYRIMDNVNVPLVVVAQNTEKYPCVYYDDYNAAKECTDFLIEKGHKDIGFIGVSEQDISVGKERKNGYIDSLKEHNIIVKESNIKIGDFNPESGYKAIKELMESKSRPTAIFAVTDNLAIGAMEYLSDNNYEIPKEVAIISIGDTRVAKVVSPKLTTVHYHYKTSGNKSAEIILELIEKGYSSSKNVEIKIKLPYGLIERKSV